MNEEQMRGWPLRFLNECKKECLVPDRIIETEEGSILFSWIRPGKYAEIEFDEVMITAWTCYETEEPEEIARLSNNYPDVFSALCRTLNEIDEFLA